MRLLWVTVAFCLLAPAGAAANDARITEEKPLTRGVELTVATPAFAAPVKVQVYLPAAYDADPKRRWPVTYYLAGTNHDENDFAEQYSGEELTRSFESIMVSPRGDSGYWSDWYNGGAFGPPRYETFVIDQLIPLIDARFRTDPTGAARAVFGESMGGYGTMMMAARHPDLFAAASSLSGVVDTNYEPMTAVLGASPAIQGGSYDAVYGPRATQEVRWRGHNPADLAENLRQVDLQLRSATGAPAPENTPPSCALEFAVHEMTVRFHGVLDGLKIPHAYKPDYGPYCHDVPTFEAEIADSLPHFNRVFAHPRKDPERFAYRSIEPEFDVWGWHVQTDPARALEFLRLEVDRTGVTLTGSGKTTVTAPPAFGRVTFTVDLGPAHTQQQFTPGAPTESMTRTVKLEPCSGRATIRLPRPATRAVVLLKGRRVRSVRGRALRRVVLTKLPAGTHRLTIRTRTGRGPWRSFRRTVRVTCPA
jgi:S-formylglutathione hydrolase FrmB